MKHAVRATLRSVGLKRRSLDAYRRLRHFGIRYYCPVCGAHLKGFAPGGEHFAVLREKSVVGGGYRPNAICPVCLCGDRERLIYLYLKQRPSLLTPPVRLLHVAPERTLGPWLRRQRNIDYVSADLIERDVMVKMDLTDICFPEDSFDAIICNHVLEHISDDAKAMAELFRVLKPSGWAILQVPISWDISATYEDASVIEPAERERVYGQSDHVRIYGADYVDRLKRVGFEVELFQWTESVEQFGGARNRYALIKEEIVFHASKLDAGRAVRIAAAL